MYADDTIAAIATAQGAGGVGIVRVSGPLTARIAAMAFERTCAADDWISHRLYHGAIVDADGAVLDEGLAVLMRAPRSYTGEDVLELHGHGSPIVLRRILSRVLRCGARLAEPGEFTKRAFLNGRIDLTQAEAVIDMVRARTEAGATLAMEQLGGNLSAALAALRDRLIHLKALLEVQIDFSEEDFTVEAGELHALVDECSMAISELLETYRRGRIMRDGLRVTIIGKPNVGKSSLLNALLGEERAIVTTIAGTTRDTIEEAADFDGVAVVLADTAGLRAADHADPVERIGMERTASKIEEADIVLAVLDISQPFDDQDRAVVRTNNTSPRIIVLNKADLPVATSAQDLDMLRDDRPMVAVSAKFGDGLHELRRAVVAAAVGDAPAEAKGPVLTNMRHVDALKKVADSLRLAQESISASRAADLVAVDVQDAIDHIGTVTGAITSEDVLDRVFSEFCIGK
jgi:tRNA modification GTPase